MKQFVEQLTEIKKDIFEIMNVNKPMDELTNEQKLEFKLSSHCSICSKKFEPDDEKVATLPLHRQIQRRNACKM